MKKITIIGAGKIGSTIANMLAGNIFPIPTPEYEITIADSYPGSFDKKSLRFLDSNHKRHVITSEKELINLLKDQDYVVNAGPYYIASEVAEAAAKTETNYFDLTEDVDQTNRIIDIANKCTNHQVFVPQCGLAPGAISIITESVTCQFNKVHDIKMRVGALPRYPNNRLKYNMTWSTDGLINEYLHSCSAIRNGQKVELEPLEGYETFSVDGDRYEAFNTSGGLGSMCDTWQQRTTNLDYKTVRYVGHHELMKFLIDDLKLGENNGHQLREILDRAIPTTMSDVVLIYVSVNGLKDKELTQDIWTKRIYGRDDWSAIQLTTAAGLCGMIELHRTGKLLNQGYVKMEHTNPVDFFNVPFVGQVY